MNEPEKCAMCKGLGYYYVLSNDIHPYVPQKGVAKACDCKSLLHKYNRLLNFVCKVSNMPNVYFQDDATEILKKIGEL
jgi:hypothetical protein